MTFVTGLTCVVCGTTYPADYGGYVCTDHGNEGILDVRYDYARIGEVITKDTLAADPDRTMWRYRPLMPVATDAPVPPLTVGGTPMYNAVPLAEQAGIAQLWVKDEGRQPTASLKDRASAMAVVKAQER
ncbi:MAG: threonine synthase, partial [Acidimicrobiia bacterium]